MLDHIQVTAYGSKASLTSLGNVVLRNPNLIVISPFDAAVGDWVHGRFWLYALPGLTIVLL